MPHEVVESVKMRVLDTLGIALAASSRGLADGVRELVAEDGGAPRASVVGSALRVPAAQAAFVNGTLAHSLDFDDTHLPSVLHPSASVVPATLAVAEERGASGREAVRAAALGIEITVRVGMGGYVEGEGNVFFERGWHATSICGTLGSAASAAVLLGLDAEWIAHALAIASSFASGVLEGNRVGGTVKRLHCGWAAHAGIIAARLAARGFTGPGSVLEGRFGLFRAFLDGHADTGAVVDGIGERWELPGIVFKPYPANHYTHAGIDAALRMRSRDGVRPEAIARLELGTSAPELRTIGEPREEKVRPRSGYHAQFSGPFTVATALIGGGGLGVYFDDFTDAKARDPDLLALAEKVETFVDEACDRAFPHTFPAVLRAHLVDGRVVEERVMHPRGTRENPLSEAELRRKFALNAAQALVPERADRLGGEILALERAPSVAGLLGLTRP
ncbi:MAG: MmgE/PrpD family protein [Chloroflexota bacterium]|nr:MmgE/PrpD family protein [Chloroflexota bacterium]